MSCIKANVYAIIKSAGLMYVYALAVKKNSSITAGFLMINARELQNAMY